MSSKRRAAKSRRVDAPHRGPEPAPASEPTPPPLLGFLAALYAGTDAGFLALRDEARLAACSRSLRGAVLSGSPRRAQLGYAASLVRDRVPLARAVMGAAERGHEELASHLVRAYGRYCLAPGHLCDADARIGIGSGTHLCGVHIGAHTHAASKPAASLWSWAARGAAKGVRPGLVAAFLERAAVEDRMPNGFSHERRCRDDSWVAKEYARAGRVDLAMPHLRRSDRPGDDLAVRIAHAHALVGVRPQCAAELERDAERQLGVRLRDRPYNGTHDEATRATLRIFARHRRTDLIVEYVARRLDCTTLYYALSTTLRLGQADAVAWLLARNAEIEPRTNLTMLLRDALASRSMTVLRMHLRAMLSSHDCDDFQSYVQNEDVYESDWEEGDELVCDVVGRYKAMMAEACQTLCDSLADGGNVSNHSGNDDCGSDGDSSSDDDSSSSSSSASYVSSAKDQ